MSSPRERGLIWSEEADSEAYTYSKRGPGDFCNIAKDRYGSDLPLASVSFKGVVYAAYSISGCSDSVLSAVSDLARSHCGGSITDAFIKYVLKKNKILIVAYTWPGAQVTARATTSSVATYKESNALLRLKKVNIMGFVFARPKTVASHLKTVLKDVKASGISMGDLLSGVGTGSYIHHYWNNSGSRRVRTRSSVDRSYSSTAKDTPDGLVVSVSENSRRRLSNVSSVALEEMTHVLYVDLVCSNASKGMQLLSKLEDPRVRATLNDKLRINYGAISLSSLDAPYSLYAGAGYLRSVDNRTVYPLYVLKKGNKMKSIYFADSASAKHLKGLDPFPVFEGDSEHDGYYMTKFLPRVSS
jgi:hypothetical protein